MKNCERVASSKFGPDVLGILIGCFASLRGRDSHSIACEQIPFHPLKKKVRIKISLRIVPNFPDVKDRRLIGSLRQRTSCKQILEQFVCRTREVLGVDLTNIDQAFLTAVFDITGIGISANRSAITAGKEKTRAKDTRNAKKMKIQI